MIGVSRLDAVVNKHDCTSPPLPMDTPSNISRIHSAPATSQQNASQCPLDPAISKSLHSPLEGKLFRIADGTRWRVLQPLSEIKLQQDISPCEARQVYTCFCLDEPRRLDGEAVVKFKFQIYASETAMHEYSGYLEDCEMNSVRFPDSEKAQGAVKMARDTLIWCTNPAQEFSEDTINEWQALERLGERQCHNAPWLYGLSRGYVRPGTHKEGIIGGYAAFLLMSKLDAKALTHKTFCEASVEQRNEIRQAFKEALMNVWDCGIIPHDCAIRNIMWNETNRKCYIIDFEQVTFVDTDTKKAPVFGNSDFRKWGLDEKGVLQK